MDGWYCFQSYVVCEPKVRSANGAKENATAKCLNARDLRSRETGMETGRGLAGDDGVGFELAEETFAANKSCLASR